MEKNPSVQWALLENVRGMLQTRRQFKGEKPMEIQTKLMAKLGFTSCFSVLVNSADFGLSQSRTRAWVLYVRTPYLEHLDIQCVRFLLEIGSFVCQIPIFFELDSL